jgi:indolepyruvate ferredoxin oxidoreductase alpha subunit
MPLETVTSAQALARAALAAGVKVVTSYPGSPSSETIAVLIDLAGEHGLHVEWSSNEKVALEIGIGASIAGRRALVGTKSVGMNVMLDPLMALNLTPVHGGLVILLGDDPGGYGSQNDQDTRPLAPMLEMPWLEPATPAEGFAMMQAAFAVSEEFHTAVILRLTRSFTRQVEPVAIPEGPHPQPDLGLVREPWRFVPVPGNVVAKHRALHERLAALERWAVASPFNRVEGEGDHGLIAAGFAHRKLLDVLGDAPRAGLRLLKLGVLFPPPRDLVAGFLAGCRSVLVLEENEPFLEGQIKAIAYDSGCRAPILGKATGHTRREGELFRWQIQRALERFLPDFVPARDYREQDEAAERPPRENYCAGCRFGAILDALRAAGARLGQDPVLVGDPGCLATAADRLDAKFAIGSAVGVADGLGRAGIPRRAVALFGDSSFFHTTLPAIANAVHHGSDLLMVLLDNGATVTSGFQANPGVPRDARGRPAPALDFERIARACGVEWVRDVGPDSVDTALPEVFHQGLTRRGLALIVVRTPCDRPASGHAEGPRSASGPAR